MKKDRIPEVDFFCIGYGNSGSTWLITCLKEHPEITISKVKEPNFFVRRMGVFGEPDNPRFMRSWKWYAAQFSSSEPGDIRGDCSINLVHNVPEAPGLIRQYYPEAKLIAILRNPIKRTQAHYWYDKQSRRLPGVPDTFMEAITNPELLKRSKYYEHLKTWFEVFPRERFHIITDFEAHDNSLGVLQATYAFLGVDPAFTPPSLLRRVNPATARNPVYVALMKLLQWARHHGLQPVMELVLKLNLARPLRFLLTRRSPYPEMSLDLYTVLKQYFLPDILQLEELLDLDLGPWKQDPGSD